LQIDSHAEGGTGGVRVATINAQLAISKAKEVAMEIRISSNTGIMYRAFHFGSQVINNSGNDGVKIGDLAENLT
jgi:hypothetical protein